MKKIPLLTTFILFATLLLFDSVEARRDGGGRGGELQGRGDRATRNFQPRQQQRQVQREFQRPPRNSGEDKRNYGARPLQGREGILRDQVQQMPLSREKLPEKRPQFRDGEPLWKEKTPSQGELKDFFGDKRQDNFPGKENFSQNREIENRKINGDKIREHVDERHPHRRDWFNDDFWRSHPGHYHFDIHGRNWWLYPTWVGVASWLAWSNSTPVYYYNGETTLYVESYGETTRRIETTFAGGESEKKEWLPLGVFTLVLGEKGDATEIYMQLAIAKSGAIAGTYYHAGNNEALPIEGLVDKTSQTASWRAVGGGETPLFSTTLYSLTEEQAPLRLQYSDGRLESGTLVRVEEPK